MINENLNNLIAAARVTTDEAQTCFGNLTVEQLNWKPGTDQWSVAQCFDHLVTAHGAYVPIIESVLSGKKKRTFWESVPFLPSLWGRFLVNGVAPESKRKLKAPKVLRPESSNIDEGIISRFIEQQNQIINYMKATQNMDLEKIIITSSVANVVTYSLMDAYRIVVNHGKRHLLQAKRVTEMDGFATGGGFAKMA